mmetsp:Transcript_16475/g.20140  ORF Transcript_16475/g.20140 Transcript_16475/m.20140 type:complete len:897 (-) Transcript_16475:37-2727(-)
MSNGYNCNNYNHLNASYYQTGPGSGPGHNRSNHTSTNDSTNDTYNYMSAASSDKSPGRPHGRGGGTDAYANHTQQQHQQYTQNFPYDHQQHAHSSSNSSNALYYQDSWPDSFSNYLGSELNRVGGGMGGSITRSPLVGNFSNSNNNVGVNHASDYLSSKSTSAQSAPGYKIMQPAEGSSSSNYSKIYAPYDQHNHHQQQQQQQQQAQSQQTHHRDHDTLYNTFIDNYRTGNHNMEMITGETSAKRNNNNGTENDSETFANVFGSSDDLKQLSLLFQQEEEKNTKTNYGGLKSIINNKTAIPSASFVCHAFDDDDAVDDKLKPLPRLVTNDSSISKRNENCALKYFTISISSLCQVPLSAYDIIDKVHLRSREVSTKYLPCVEFLVMCQQELRNAVAIATQHRKGYSAQQFYNQYFITLYQRFCRQNERRMPPEALAEASAGIKLLLSDVSKLIRKGSFEKMKNMFLGGMRDGESWGLRKWVSKHGGALKICNDLELIWGALRELPRDDESTKILAERLRPKMKKALERLVDEVPKAYQEISTAHPYLPFFHRLESVLKGLSEFDPEDDDVICLDMSDDEVQELKTPAKSTTTKLKSSVPNTGGTVSSLNQNEHKGYESDDSDIEIFCIKDVNGQRLDVGSTQATANNPRKPWTCNVCECPNSADERICTICDAKYDTLNNYEAEKKTSASSFSLNDTLRSASAIQLTQCIGGIVSEIESGNEKRFQTSPQLNPTAFWTRSDNYVVVLQIFQTLILENSTGYLLDFVAESPTDISRIIAILKNPLTFRDIAVALSDSESKGFLRSPLLKGSSTLKQWNLYEGKYLIEAIDLVFLNFLVLQGKTRSSARNSVEALHSLFWGKIKEAASYDNKLIPRRRREISEFVINKKQSAFKDDFG